jgi:hypothetical protein
MTGSSELRATSRSVGSGGVTRSREAARVRAVLRTVCMVPHGGGLKVRRQPVAQLAVAPAVCHVALGPSPRPGTRAPCPFADIGRAGGSSGGICVGSRLNNVVETRHYKIRATTPLGTILSAAASLPGCAELCSGNFRPLKLDAGNIPPVISWTGRQPDFLQQLFAYCWQARNGMRDRFGLPVPH